MKKKMLSYLTALSILFGSQSFMSPVKSEEIYDESSYEPLPIFTIFNYEPKKKFRDYSELTLAIFNGDKVLINSNTSVFTILTTDEKIDYSGSTISFSKLKEDFDLGEDFVPNNEIRITFERESMKPIYMIDRITRDTYICKNYFLELMKNPRYSEIIEVRTFYESELEDLLEEMGAVNHSLSGRLYTYSEYMDQFYKKYIPKAYWPVRFNFNNVEINNTVPKLKDEILNQQLIDSGIGFTILFENETNKRKVIKRVFLDRARINPSLSNDIFSNEQITNNNKLSENIPEFKHDYEFFALEKNDINFVLNIDYFFGMYNYKSFDENNVIEIMLEGLWNSETIGDLIEYYNMLPIELTTDYSKYDLTDNPDIDHSIYVKDPKGSIVINRDSMNIMLTPEISEGSQENSSMQETYTELTVGSRGQEVLNMKKRFYELGYFRTTEFNNRFTEATEGTVKLFEQNNGLPVDGTADPEMLTLLFSDNAVRR